MPTPTPFPGVTIIDDTSTFSDSLPAPREPDTLVGTSSNPLVAQVTLPLPVPPEVLVVFLVILGILLFNKIKNFLKAHLGIFYYPIMLFFVYPTIILLVVRVVWKIFIDPTISLP